MRKVVVLGLIVKVDIGGGEKFPDNGLIYGAEMTTTLTGGILGLGIGADYFQFKKSIEEGEVTLLLVPASATLYLFPPIKGLYLGVGASYHIARLEVTPQPSGWPENSALGGNIGYHGVLGYNIARFIFIEGKYSTCNISEWKSGGVTVNPEVSEVGGITVLLGLSI